MRKITYLLFATLVLIPACQFSRENFFEIASAQPDIHIIPNTTNVFDFGVVDMYDTRTQTFYIENLGLRDLSLTKLYTSDPSKKEFIIDSTYTVSTLKPGETTFFTISFKPVSVEATTVNMVIESNDPDEQLYRFSLNGEGGYSSGIPPTIIVKDSGTEITGNGTYMSQFGDVAVGQSSPPKEFTITNSTSARYKLSVTDININDSDLTPHSDEIQFKKIAPDIPASLNPGQSVIFTVAFAPESNIDYPTQIDYQAQLEIVSDDPVNQSFIFSLIGTGILAPDICITHGLSEIPYNGKLSFGTIQDDESIIKLINIENTGNLPLQVSGFYIDPNPVFIVTGSFPKQVMPGGKTSMEIKFEPNLMSGLFNANIDIFSDDPDESPFTFIVEGIADPSPKPDINVLNADTGTEVPSGSLGYDYTTVSLGTALTVPFTIENTGTLDLSVSNIYVSGNDASQFGIDATFPNTIPPNGNMVFNVTYTPTNNNVHKTTVVIDNNDPDSEENPYLFEVAGKGTDKDVPDIQIQVENKKYESGSSYYFSTFMSPIYYGNSITRTFTIKNTGKAVLLVSDVLIVSGDGEDFSFELSVPVTITAGGTVDFNVTFKPTVNPFLFAQKRSVRLQIKGNDPDENPFKIDLIGYVR